MNFARLDSRSFIMSVLGTYLLSLLLTLPVAFFSTDQTANAQVGAYTQNLFGTGKGGTVNAQTKRTNANIDPGTQTWIRDSNWRVNRIYSDAGLNNSIATNQPFPANITTTCQYYSGAVGANAVIVNESTRSGLVKAGLFPEGTFYRAAPGDNPYPYTNANWPGDFPWLGSNTARWVSINPLGWHDGYGVGKPPTPAGECHDPSGITNPDGTLRELDGNPATSPDFPDLGFWHTYVFRYNRTLANIPNNVDLNSLRIEMDGAADNHIGVVVNNQAMNIQCGEKNSDGSLRDVNEHENHIRVSPTVFQDGDFSLWGQGDPVQPGTTPYLPLCSPSFRLSSSTIYVTRRSANSPFVRNGSGNTIEIHVKSALSNVGMLLESIRLIGDIVVTPPAPQVSCEFVPNGPNNIELGQDLYPVARVTNANLAGRPALNVTVNVSINTAPAQSRTASSTAALPANGTGRTFGVSGGPAAPTVDNVATVNTPFTGIAAGVYTLSGTASWTAPSTGATGTATCPAVTVSVVTRPYFKVLGGDAYAFGSTQMRGWNQFGQVYPSTNPCLASFRSNGRCGSGVQGSVMIETTNSGSIGGIKSGFENNGLKYSTFANSNALQWGGGFGSSSLFPAPNYVRPAALGTGEQDLGAGNWPGNSSWTGRTTYYVNGDLTITGNVAYASSATGYASINNIPYLRIVATGNIYISPNVVRLDGEYISGGIIFTCHNGTASWGIPVITVNIVNACANQLTVNGSLLAPSVRLTRTGGTLANATANDHSSNRNNIAEIIQFSPEIYLSTPAGDDEVEPPAPYQSITALPPLL